MQQLMTMSSANDPRVLLDAMSSMLGEYGDIKGPQEVATIISLMKDAEKLLSRYTFLNILRATMELAAENGGALETVHKFVKDGGCAILNRWLQEGMKLENLPLILDVLELLEAMPITIEALKQGNIGKLVKQLSKNEEQEVKDLASNVLSKWMTLVKGKPKKSKKSSERNEDSNTGSSPTMKRARENSTSKEPSGKSVGQPPEKKSKSLAEARNSVTSVAKPPPKTKVIPALPKPVVMESSGFMNALIQPAPAMKKKKKVAPPPSPKQTSAGPLEEILFNQAQTHKQGEEKDKSNKEKEEKETGAEKTSDENQPSEGELPETSASPQNGNPAEEVSTEQSAPNPSSATSTSDETTASEEPDTTARTVSAAAAAAADVVEVMDTETSGVQVESEGNKIGLIKKKKKRSIKWAEDEKLVVYHYYEPDDEERVQHVVNFHDAQHQEAMRERQRVEQAKRLSEDKMMEQLTWYRPRPLDVSELMERGKNSQEKVTQKERESKILAHLFFSKSSLPISPGEPEPDAMPASVTSSQPIVIPHDEKGTVYPQTKGIVDSETAEEELTPQDANVSLPPALAALLATATKGANNSGSNTTGPGNNTGLSNVDVQALLKKLMASQEQGEQSTNVQSEHAGPRFSSPHMNQQTLRIPGRVGPDALRHGLPEFRSRGLLPTPKPLMDPTRFLGPLRGRFPPPGGPRLRHPMPGQRIPGPGMGRGAMLHRFPMPNKNQETGEEYYNDQYSDGEIPEGQFPGRGRAIRPRGGRGRPICRHFKTPRGCMRGNNCPFLHVGVSRPPV